MEGKENTYIIFGTKINDILHSPIIRIIFVLKGLTSLFYARKKKSVYYFLKKNKCRRCLMEGKLNTCMWHIHLYI